MTNLFLILTYLGCLSSGAMLSMLLLLVGAYISASLWLISHGVIYTGLLYILVYVGAIVVLIMFVVQLTNTSLAGDHTHLSSSLNLVQNTILVVCLTLLLGSAFSILDTHFILSLSHFHLTQAVSTPNNDLIPSLLLNQNSNPLTHLAFSIFNEYGYILVLSVHAIILAVIGPIKLALSDLK